MSIVIPADQANTWGSSDQVGIAESISLGEFGSLALLIEKDFACLDRSEEDNKVPSQTQTRANNVSLRDRAERTTEGALHSPYSEN